MSTRSHFRLTWPRVTLACVGLLAAGSACAQTEMPDEVQLEPGKGQGTLRVGGAVVNRPAYLGSGDRVTRLAPVVNYRTGGFFVGTTTGLGYNFSDTPGQQYGLRLSLAPGRKEDASPRLAGMGDIKAKPELGGFFNLSVSRQLRLNYTLKVGAGDSGHGVLGVVGGTYLQPLAPAWLLSLGSQLSLANGSLMQTYFGVTADQAATSGYARYTPAAGLRDWTNKAMLTHLMSHGIAVTGGLSAVTLMGDAADSPLTEQTTNLSAFLAVTYSF